MGKGGARDAACEARTLARLSLFPDRCFPLAPSSLLLLLLLGTDVAVGRTPGPRSGGKPLRAFQTMRPAAGRRRQGEASFKMSAPLPLTPTKRQRSADGKAPAAQPSTGLSLIVVRPAPAHAHVAPAERSGPEGTPAGAAVNGPLAYCAS